MADRMRDYGMDRALHTRMHAKYDPSTETECRRWILDLTGDDIGQGSDNVQRFMKDGQTLVKLAAAVRNGTSQCPSAAARMKLVPSASGLAFKQMENIEIFTTFCELYGVPKNSCFPTVDLYENRNMPAVFATILQLGSECQRNGFNGPVIGPKPADRNVRQFSKEQLRAGEGMIGLQAGTNQFASQKGMKMGASRHIADIRADDMDREGQGVIGLQAGTNQFASQKGMRIGASRHIADFMPDGEMTTDSHGVIGLQAGTNQFATQKGMRMGAIRHISDFKHDGDASMEGQGVIGLQAGTNQFASQKGMSFGATRHIADIRADDMTMEGQGVIGLQAGTNQFASQKGMRGMGATRHIADIRADQMEREGQGVIGLQAGTNQFASQKGMRGMGATRHIADIRADDLSLEGSATINLQMGSNQYASQAGMNFGKNRGIMD